MSFKDLISWLEKKSNENPAEDAPQEVTSSGGVKLPPISGGVPVGE
jgi:hypothetical protein